MRSFDKLRMSGVAAALLLALAGCQKSFDDRYADAQKAVQSQAASIDQELAAKESEAALAAPAPVVTASFDPPLKGEGDRDAKRRGGGVLPSR